MKKLLLLCLLTSAIFAESMKNNTNIKNVDTQKGITIDQSIDEEIGIVIVCINDLAFMSTSDSNTPYTQILGINGKPTRCSTLFDGKNYDK